VVTSLALKLKLVAHELAFLAQIIVVSSSHGDVGSLKDGVDSSVGDFYGCN
jgi:hypothetical protein